MNHRGGTGEAVAVGLAWRVRTGCIDDAPHIAAFNVAMALETEGRVIEHARLEAGVRGMFERPQHGFYLVAEAAGACIGCLMITYEWSDWRNGFFWWVQSVYTVPQWRRRGVYRSLYEEARARARASGECCGLRLYVEKENVGAQRGYEALGMRRTDYLIYEESPLSETPSGCGDGR